jgi:hypothetical protein
MSAKRSSSLTRRITPVQWIGVAEGCGVAFFENFNQESQGAGAFFPTETASGFGSVEVTSFLKVAHPVIVRVIKRTANIRQFFKGDVGLEIFLRDAGRWV